MVRTIRLLTFTNLYPNSQQPTHGLFVHRRLRRIVDTGRAAAVVVAPTPLSLTRTLPARVEEYAGLSIHHPRFASVPGLGRILAPFTMALSSWRIVRALVRQGDVDVIDAHYFYPDGIAATLLACAFGKPLVITARGTDINVLPNYMFSRGLIRWAAKRAAKIIAVSEALRVRLIALGTDPDKVITLRNGVDQSEFKPLDRAEARAHLNIPDATVLLSVGNLIEPKGHHLAIESLRELGDAYLVIVGDGPLRSGLERVARENGVVERVRFTGPLTAEKLIEYYSAADLLVLATLREGMPNVVLEAISCGLPVVATDCGGISEVVDRPEAGILMRERSAAAIVAAVRTLRQRYPSRAETRACAGRFDWNCTVNRQLEVYASVASEPG